MSSMQCRPRLKSLARAQVLVSNLAHARHDPHAQHDVNANRSVRGRLWSAANRAAPSGKEPRRACVRACRRRKGRGACGTSPPARAQLLVGPASSAVGVQINVRSSLRATSSRVGAVIIAAGQFFLVEPEQDAARDGLLEQQCLFGFGAIAPEDVVGLAKRGHFLHPTQDGRI